MSYSAFGEMDYAAIARYLGYSFTPSDLGTIQLACANVQNLGGVYVEQVKGLLEELDKIQAEINEARPFAARSFQSSGSGSAQFFKGERMHHSRVEGKGKVDQLCQLLNLNKRRDIFAPGGGSGGAVVMG